MIVKNGSAPNVKQKYLYHARSRPSPIVDVILFGKLGCKPISEVREY
jgi:hypothetical protein